MQNKSSLKYYVIVVVVLVVIVLIVVLAGGKSKSTEEKKEATNTMANSVTNVPLTPEVNTNSNTNSDLVGTWVSATPGKGMEGSEKIVTARSSTTITTSGDVNITIEKVENGTAIGKIAYTNLCYTTTITFSGKTSAPSAPKCINTPSANARIKVSGNTLSYNGVTALSSDVSFTGTYSGNTITGTFVRTGAYGKVTGTLNLVRA